MSEFSLFKDTVSFDEEKKALVIIDQTKLPNKFELLYLTDIKEIFEAIYRLKVRGAPAIGVAAAIGLYIVSLKINTDNIREFKDELQKAKAYLATSRPTAVNLFWALNQMEEVALEYGGSNVGELKELLHKKAVEILENDIKVCRALGEYGLTLLKDGDGILTHCNAGQLATVRYGTALAPIHLGIEKGMSFRVYTDETRPLLQGARLSAYELTAHGVQTTVICDNMASSVMKKGWVNIVFTGADTVASNGDTANKIGTSAVAILAKYYKIPFYIFAPLSTIDLSINSGEDIPIEERDGEEVTTMWYKERMAPKDAKVYNPAFDVTDNSLITGIVTEYGIVYPPFNENLKKIVFKKISKNLVPNNPSVTS